jgi:hypothetical protein
MADRNSTSGGELTGRLAKKLLMPLVATAVSGLAGYAGKKAPQLLEQKLMPKLREATPDRSVGDLADGLAERAKAVVGNQRADARPAKRSSPAQLEERRRQRAADRKARRTGPGPKED